jgi:hypothetical protein
MGARQLCVAQKYQCFQKRLAVSVLPWPHNSRNDSLSAQARSFQVVVFDLIKSCTRSVRHVFGAVQSQIFAALD